MSDWRSMPPLSALRAFSAFAETGSVQRAGERLNVSHAAISQQLRALWVHTDVSLIDRTTRRMMLPALPWVQEYGTSESTGWLAAVDAGPATDQLVSAGVTI